jgi:hypothetical protein
MTIDFPKNVGHIADYESCKNFVYKKLVRNTVDKAEWENYLLDACQLWPTAASYLHKLARDKTRWGSPWRYEHFTAGYESSSPVEGSFSSFQRYVGDDPLSFVGVVQRSCRKDREKLQEERVFTNRDNISRTDQYKYLFAKSRHQPQIVCLGNYFFQLLGRSFLNDLLCYDLPSFENKGICRNCRCCYD